MLKSLLGLGLNYCPAPTTTTPLQNINIDRFEKDYHWCILFSNGPELHCSKPLYLQNEVFKPLMPANPELYSRGYNFINEIANLFLKQKNRSINYYPSAV